ncbi:Peptidase family S41 [Polaromonas sp. OV174]|uniref:S41 family peptidase n=1 Tax=Polaromonas sp. OV174 TaxID=1855300 RepID=UPI0008F2CC0B|nr:S41 family peptidase [Polaromonas sp. OV174]SFC21541.1 Peptidase family S41 [Polaromonas sp. OV174]
MSYGYDFVGSSLKFDAGHGRQLSREGVIADLRALQVIIDDVSSYALSVTYPYAQVIDRLIDGLGASTSTASLAMAIQKLVQQIGDAHAKVTNYESFLPPGYVSCAFGLEGRRYFVYDPLDRVLLNPGFPYVESIDGVPVIEWYKIAAELSAGPYGSDSSKINRALPLLRYVNYLRLELGLPLLPVVKLGLVSDDSQHRLVHELTIEADLCKAPLPLYLPQESRLLPGNIGYLRVHSQSNAELTAQLPGLMAKFADTQALVIDARQCGGGVRDNLMALFPYFMAAGERPYIANLCKLKIPKSSGKAEDFDPIGKLDVWDKKVPYRRDARIDPEVESALEAFICDFTAEWLVPDAQFTDWYYMAMQPSPQAYCYGKPVYLLVDWGVGSAGDIFVSTFKDRANVTVCGMPTNGRSGNSKPYSLANSGVEVMISTMASFQKSGQLYEGAGIYPDVFMSPTLNDWLGHSDSQLDRVVRSIQSACAC